MGSCQNYGPFLGTLNIRCRIRLRTQKGTLILTTTQMLGFRFRAYGYNYTNHPSAQNPYPKGPCTQIEYTLAPKYLNGDYFKANVYTI